MMQGLTHGDHSVSRHHYGLLSLLIHGHLWMWTLPSRPLSCGDPSYSKLQYWRLPGAAQKCRISDHTAGWRLLLLPTRGPPLGVKPSHLHAGHIDAGPDLEVGAHLDDPGYTVQQHVVELRETRAGVCAQRRGGKHRRAGFISPRGLSTPGLPPLSPCAGPAHRTTRV